jgi:hypothetical protein
VVLLLGAALGAAAAGCQHREAAGALHARKVVLEREVKGLRAVVARLESGETIFPEDALLVSIAEGVVKDFVSAQLPVSVELERFRIELKRATAIFKGTPALTLSGSIVHADHPDLVGEVAAIGSLDKIQVEPSSGTLRADVTVDHVDLLRIGGLEKLLAGGTVDELARALRKQLDGRCPGSRSR